MRLVDIDLITSVKVVYLIHILLVTVATPSFHPEVSKLPWMPAVVLGGKHWGPNRAAMRWGSGTGVETSKSL